MSYIWNRVGKTPKCNLCNQRITVGQLVMHKGDGLYQHDECPEIKITDLGKAMVIMGDWANFKPVKTKDLVKAAKDLIAFFEAEEANK